MRSMLRAVVLAAVLQLFASASACSCSRIAPLSECSVLDDEAVLLVIIKNFATTHCDTCDCPGTAGGRAVAEVEIERVFKDRTKLNLQAGGNVFIGSSLSSAECGEGYLFSNGERWIMYASVPFMPESQTGSSALEVAPLPFASTPSQTPQAATEDDNFAKLPSCDLDKADDDLVIGLCSRNVQQPTQADIGAIEPGCLNPASAPRPVSSFPPTSEQCTRSSVAHVQQLLCCLQTHAYAHACVTRMYTCGRPTTSRSSHRSHACRSSSVTRLAILNSCPTPGAATTVRLQAWV